MMPRECPAKRIEIGDVGYVFRKKFACGWYTGEVVKILPRGLRSIVYDDGDSEDLTLKCLIKLANMEPNVNQHNGGVCIGLESSHSSTSSSTFDGRATEKALEVYRGKTLVARFKTQKDCAKFLHVSATTVCNHCKNGGGVCNGYEIRLRHFPARLSATVDYGIFEETTPRPRSTDPVELASSELNVGHRDRDRASGNKLNDDSSDADEAPSRGSTNKRKYASDPTAVAARGVLSDTDDENYALCDTDNEFEPNAHVASRKKKLSIASSKVAMEEDTRTIDAGGAWVGEKQAARRPKIYERGHLKPRFEVGEAVYAPWWDISRTEKRHRSGSNVDGWFPGMVSSYKEVDIDSPYGPIRYYDILFDDGDEEKELEDYWVWSKEDYSLDTQDDGLKNWMGVTNVVDSKAVDKWARITGWWAAKIDRKDQHFSRLSEALDAYDMYTIQHMGESIKPRDLNRPEKWNLFLGLGQSNDDNPDDATPEIASHVEISGDQETTIVAIDSATSINASRNEVVETASANIAKHATTELMKESKINSKKGKVRRKVAVTVGKSKFTGVYLKKKGGAFSLVHRRPTTFNLGSWTLQADAARARDRACKLLWGGNCRQLNFTSRHDYIIQRMKELENLAVDSDNNMELVESVSSVSTRITNILSKIPCPEVDAKYVEMTKKWGCLLPQETGKEFLDSYQKTIDDMFTSTTPPELEVESIPHDVENEAVVSVAVSNIGNDPADLLDDDDASLFSSVAEASAHSDVESSASSSDDDASLFRSVAEASASDMECSASSEIANAVDADQNSTMLTGERTEEINEVKLPIGCPVMWNFVGNTFCTGTIFSAPDSAAMYTVTPSNSSGADSSNISISAKELGFGINCPVFVSPACGSKTQPLQGRILFGGRDPLSPNNFSYCVIVSKDQNEFHVLKGVLPERLTYRIANPVCHVPAYDTQTLVRDEFHSTMQGLSGPGLMSAAEDNDSRKSGQFTSSGSTITTECSTAVACLSGDRPCSQNITCRVFFPRWLVHDSESRKKLFSYLLSTDSKAQCLRWIGTRSNCSLRIIEEDGPCVLIETKQGKYSTEDLRSAASGLDRALLGFLGNDGSIGRLFYDLARSCKFLHPTGPAGSTSVMQCNPFSQDHEMGWMDIVELPYSTDERKHHGSFLLMKGGVLGRIRQEACEIKVCGIHYNYRTKCCPPYVWVMGDQPGKVDRAVAILRDEIQRHMQFCGCRL